MGHRDAMLSERYGAVRGAAAPFPAAPPSKWRPFNNSVIFRPICFKFGKKVDCRMGNDAATPPQRYGAVRGAISGGATFKMAPIQELIFQPICFKFGWKVDRRMGNGVATPPQRYGAVGGAAAPFLAAPPSKWRPFKNSVIFWPICFKFC